jgi:hypothetical protein
MGTEGISPEKDYKTQLGDILSRQLTPQNIDSYAHQALSDLIVLTDQVTRDFECRAGNNLDSVDSVDSRKDFEDEAYKYFGLENIENILGHIGRVATTIDSLDEIIDGVTLLDRVIVPPGNNDIELIKPGNGEFDKYETVPKLKILLFLLKENFQLDIADIDIKGGKLSPEMMRNETYYLVTIPDINRTVLTCDELGW